jgi:hypothetical protein
LKFVAGVGESIAGNRSDFVKIENSKTVRNLRQLLEIYSFEQLNNLATSKSCCYWTDCNPVWG